MSDKPETIDVGVTVPEAAVQILTLRQWVRDYHLALDMREHNAGAAQSLVKKLETMFDMPWVQGEELQKQRAGK